MVHHHHHWIHERNHRKWYMNIALQKAMQETSWGSLVEFWRDMEKRFGDANPKLTTRAQHSKINQGTHSVDMPRMQQRLMELEI